METIILRFHVSFRECRQIYTRPMDPLGWKNPGKHTRFQSETLFMGLVGQFTFFQHLRFIQINHSLDIQTPVEEVFEPPNIS